MTSLFWGGGRSAENSEKSRPTQKFLPPLEQRASCGTVNGELYRYNGAMCGVLNILTRYGR